MKSKAPIFLFFFLFLSVNLFSQTKPKPISQSQLVKNAIIKQTKEACALPKYYKTEQIKVNLVSPSKPYETEIGINRVDLPDSFYRSNFLFLKPGMEHENILAGVGYKIVKINTQKTPLGWNCLVSYKSLDSTIQTESLIIYDREDYVDDNTSKLEVYNSKKKVKLVSSAMYEVDYFYWAMSNGGVVRLYHETGDAFIDKKGVVTYYGEAD